MIAGAAFGLIGWLLPFLLERRLFRWAGYAGLLASWVLMARTAGGEMTDQLAVFRVMFFIVLGSLPWSGFVVLALGTNLNFLVSWAMSDDRLKVPPSYSMAEAAEARGELPQAIAAYAKIADENPADPEPKRRMAETLLKAGKPREAADTLRQALRIEDKPVEKFLLVLRMSEVLAEDCGDLRAAIGLLEGHLERHPDAHGADFARERIQRLKKRQAAKRRPRP